MINAESPKIERECQGCGGAKQQPMCADLSIGYVKGFNATIGDIEDSYVNFSLCLECGNDLVNALGFFVLSRKRDMPVRRHYKPKKTKK